VGGPTNGIQASQADHLGSHAYNVVSNLKNHFERQEIDFQNVNQK
jgi:hypothetical protein